MVKRDEEVEEQENQPESEKGEVATPVPAKTRSSRSKPVAVVEDKEPSSVPETSTSAPIPPPAWGRATERPVVPPPPSLSAVPAPVTDSTPRPNPVVVDEAMKPEPEQGATDEVQSSGIGGQATPKRRVEPPGIIGGGVRGGVPGGDAGSPGRPG